MRCTVEQLAVRMCAIQTETFLPCSIGLCMSHQASQSHLEVAHVWLCLLQCLSCTCKSEAPVTHKVSPELLTFVVYVAGSAVSKASSEAMERIMLWQISNLQQWDTGTYLDGSRLFARLSEHCLGWSSDGLPAVANVTIETAGELLIFLC